MRFFPLWLVEIETIPSPMWALATSVYSSAVILSQTQVVSSHMCTDKSSSSGWGDILRVSRSLSAAPPLLVFCPTNYIPPWTPPTLSFPTQLVGVPLGWGWVPLLCCGLEATPAQYAVVTGDLSFFSGATPVLHTDQWVRAIVSCVLFSFLVIWRARGVGIWFL